MGGAVCRRLQELFQVKIHDPAVAVGDVLLRLGHGLMGRAVGAEAVAVRRERPVPARLEHLQHCLLEEAVQDGGNPQGPPLAVRLRDVDAADRLRLVPVETQAVLQERQAGLGRVAHPPVDAWRMLAVILLGHLSDRQELDGA